MHTTFQDWALLTLLSLLWGGAFFFATVAVAGLPVLTVAALRAGIAAIALFAFPQNRGAVWPPAGRSVPALFIMGLPNNLIPFSLLFRALTLIPSGLASILNAATPIFSIIVVHFPLVDKRRAANKVIGILSGLPGVVALFGGDALNGIDISVVGMPACQ